MRNIATKLLISIGIATICFFVYLLCQTYSLTNRRVKDVIGQQASMALKFDLAIRKYVDQKIRPLMYELVGEDEFIPETMSTSYVARSIFDDVRDEFPDYILKFSSDNPRNPENQAGPEELKAIEYLNNHPDLNRWEGEISIDGKQYMAKFSARRMKESCLRCHGDPKYAPASLLKRYGSITGFHRPIGRIIGSDTIAIPMKKIYEQLWSESIPTFLVSGLSLLLFFLAIFLAIRFVITNRLTMISKHFVNASQQEDYSNINPIEIKGRDEIFDLAFSFNTLSSKLRDFYSSLDRQVKERTRELADKNEQLQFEIEERKQAEEEVKLNEQRLEALLELNQMTEATLEEITAFAMEEAVRLTQSKIGYVAFVSEDESILTMHAWSRQALRECRTAEKPIIYPVVNTGLWGEAVRQRRPVITNNYQEPNPLKKGMPEGHVKVIRHMNVPIFDGDRIVVVAGVGNKETDYDDSDVRQLTLLMSGMWRIVQRKRIEETLRESEGKYRTVLETNPDPVVVYDMEGKVIYFNPAFTRVFGWTLEECLRKKMDIFVPDDEQYETQKMVKKVLAGESFSGFETCRYTKAGNIIYVNMNAAIYKDQNNNPIGSVINLRNITEQKKLEAQLQQVQKMQSIGTLAGGIAHDFNNILGIIFGNTELAIDDVPEWNPARLHLEEIRIASLRAKDVVRQLLSFARKTKLEKKPTNIIPIVKESLKLLRSSIPTSIEICQNISKNVDTILADPTQINQILINLCTNADHAMPDGGIIEVNLKNVELEENNEAQYPELRPGRYVNLIVRDTGHGISRNEIHRIFDPYFTTKEVGKGTGMGLAVVHGIVKGHNGLITVKSELGKGTTFSIFFPSVEKDAVVEIESNEKLPTGNERILFIDDEESLVKIGRKRLERLGYKVETTTSPIEALDLFRSKPEQYDLIITDMAMPQMTGDKLITEFLAIRPNMPIILCTGFSEKIDEKRAKKMGIRQYIEKPLDKQDLAVSIRQVLDEKKILKNIAGDPVISDMCFDVG